METGRYQSVPWGRAADGLDGASRRNLQTIVDTTFERFALDSAISSDKLRGSWVSVVQRPLHSGPECKTTIITGDWCNGSTTDSGSVSKGSNPLSPVAPKPLETGALGWWKSKELRTPRTARTKNEPITARTEPNLSPPAVVFAKFVKSVRGGSDFFNASFPLALAGCRTRRKNLAEIFDFGDSGCYYVSIL